VVKDVLIIGGGVIGLSIARALHKQGVTRLAVVEMGVCGQESSWAAAGMLGPQTEADADGPFFDLCCASRDLYPTFSAELLDETGVDIELERSGTLYLAFNPDEARVLRERHDWQRAAGLAVELLSANEARRAEPFVSPDVEAALLFPNDWQVENRKLLDALRRYATLNGIDILENTLIESLTVESGRVTGADASTQSIFAGKTVIATGAWTSLIKLGTKPMPLDITPVRGQMIAYRTAQRSFQRIIYSRDGYLVPRRDGRILAGSTSENAGFDRAVTDSAERALRAMACEIAPGLAGLEIADRWSGLRPFAADGLPVLGSLTGVDGLTIATAHYRNGILLAPLTATLVSESLTGAKKSGYLETFGPDRFRPRGIATGS